MRRGLAALALGLVVACSGPTVRAGWQGRVESWGTMHAVMMEGRSEGRVNVLAQQGDTARIGIGSLAGPAGEIVLIDGVAWITRSEELGALVTDAGARREDQATMLVTAEVPRWSEVSIPGGLAPDALEGFVESAARGHGLERTPVFPFVIEGELEDLRVHVLHGRCPMQGNGPIETEPVRRFLPRVHGRLVGFWSRLEPGTLTHAGERAHLHVLVREGEPLAAHVDRVRIGPGARLRLPIP